LKLYTLCPLKLFALFEAPLPLLKLFTFFLYVQCVFCLKSS